jgi:Guanosine polyphosphate pyrophosphohydrolases/synthetases
VFGFISSGEGLKVHRYDCPNAQSLLANYAHRIVKIKWAKNKEISFLTGVRIIGLDDVGIVQGITHVITTEMRINMRSISIDSQDGVFDGTIKVFVKDKEELDLLCSKLEKNFRRTESIKVRRGKLMIPVKEQDANHTLYSCRYPVSTGQLVASCH